MCQHRFSQCHTVFKYTYRYYSNCFNHLLSKIILIKIHFTISSLTRITPLNKIENIRHLIKFKKIEAFIVYIELVRSI